MSDRSKIKMRTNVRIPVLETGEEVNREYNVYEVAGRDFMNRIWLSLLKFQIEDEHGHTKWVKGDKYDGYNSDIILAPLPDGKWELVLCDERCRLNFLTKPGDIALEEV
jgi:hypothetical protein